MDFKIAIIEFPGSFGADDFINALKKYFSVDAYKVWHLDENLKKPNLVIIPGGYAFGDYLRPGALTIGSPIVDSLRRYCNDGGKVLGVGNGFQILCELKLLPGILLENNSLEFLNTDIFVSIARNDVSFTKNFTKEEVVSVPIACRYGRFWADKRTLNELKEISSVIFRFCDIEGEVDYKNPFNDSVEAIAGIQNRTGNILGVIFRPERCCSTVSAPGYRLISGLIGNEL